MKKPPLWGLLGVLALLVGVALLALPRALRAVGRFLVVADRLDISDAIVVMSGEIPFRLIEAARLFQGGLAPRIILTRHPEPARRRKLRDLGLAGPDRTELARMVLERLNVPIGSIGVVPDPAHNTAEELAAVHRFAVKEGLRRIIIVSSPDHMRRIRLIWRRGVGADVAALLHPAPEEEGFNPGRWWTSPVGRRHLVHEYLGMLRFLISP
jgi:uncharacterized SAM-binding protein YcdF (DUF218 family)